MTAAEHHQQQLEEQRLIEELHLRADMARNHGKFLGVARFVRDNPEKACVKIALKYLQQALEEHDELSKKEKEYAASRLA